MQSGLNACTLSSVSERRVAFRRVLAGCELTETRMRQWGWQEWFCPNCSVFHRGRRRCGEWWIKCSHCGASWAVGYLLYPLRGHNGKMPLDYIIPRAEVMPRRRKQDEPLHRVVGTGEPPEDDKK